jgi:hypothetical protein
LRLTAVIGARSSHKDRGFDLSDLRFDANAADWPARLTSIVFVELIGGEDGAAVDRLSKPRWRRQVQSSPPTRRCWPNMDSTCSAGLKNPPVPITV